MPFLDVATGRVYFRHWAAEAPRAQALLLHGFGEHTGHYHRLAAHLTSVGIDVWAPDHIGHGLTGGEPGMFDTVDDLADNAVVVLDFARRRAPHLPIAVIGHSLGALTGVRVAANTDDVVRALVLTGAPLWGLPAAAEGRTDLIMAVDEEYLDALENDPLGFDTGPAEGNLWRVLNTAGPAVARELSETSTPVVFINGQHDAFAYPENALALAATMPHGRAVAIRGGYHDIPNDRAHRRVAGLISAAVVKYCLVRTTELNCPLVDNRTIEL